MENKLKRSHEHDEKLTKAFLACNEDAVRTVVELYRDGMILYANGIVRNIIAAEDVVCEAFAKMIAKKPKIKNAAYFKTYLYSVVKRCAYDYVRADRKTRYRAGR